MNVLEFLKFAKKWRLALAVLILCYTIQGFQLPQNHTPEAIMIGLGLLAISVLAITPDILEYHKWVKSGKPERPQKDNRPYLRDNRPYFMQMLDSLPKVPIKRNPNYRIVPEDMKSIRFSYITAKTDISKLGNYVVIDLETTGLPRYSSIVEISAVRFADFKPVSCFTTLVKPPIPIPANATKIHGITDRMVANAPRLEEITEALFDYVGDSTIIGHNLSFDIGILENKGITFGKRKYFDTLSLARKKLDGKVTNFKLDTLCRYYHIYRDNAHRAASDCLATGLIFNRLVNG